MVWRNRIVQGVKKYKQSDKTIIFIPNANAQENWIKGIDSGRTKPSTAKNTKRHLLGNVALALLFFTGIMPFNHVDRKRWLKAYKLSKLQEKINPLMCMDDRKIFAKKIKENLRTFYQKIRIYSQDIGMEFGIEKLARQTMNRRKRKSV